MIATFWATARDSVALPVVVTILTVAASLGLQRAADRRSQRRDRYSQVLGTLVAWIEYPYRVRRRTSDDPATLTALADRGHDLQEQLARDQSWVIAESKHVATAYAAARSVISCEVGAAIKDAWEHPHVTTSADMNLNGWGPHSACNTAISTLESTIASRLRWWNKPDKEATT